MTPKLRPLVLTSEEGPTVEMGPLEQIMFKATGPATGGAFDLLEVTRQPGGGPPEHVHHRNDEAYYLIEGSCQVKFGNDVFAVTPGSFIFVPRGTPHTFGNTSAKPARMLVMVTPDFLAVDPLRHRGGPAEPRLGRASGRDAGDPRRRAEPRR